MTKKINLTKTKKKADKQQAIAFANWVVFKEGTDREFRGGRGWPMFQNPEYPNPQEDKLIALAKAQGGSVELTMRVTININKQNEIKDIDISEFI